MLFIHARVDYINLVGAKEHHIVIVWPNKAWKVFSVPASWFLVCPIYRM